MQRLNSTHVQIRACPFTHRHAKPIYRTPHHTCACTLTPSAIIFQYVLGEERFLKNRKRWHDYMLKARWVKDCRAGIWVLVAGYWASFTIYDLHLLDALVPCLLGWDRALVPVRVTTSVCSLLDEDLSRVTTAAIMNPFYRPCPQRIPSRWQWILHLSGRDHTRLLDSWSA